MIYPNIENNIISLLQSIGTLEHDQLLRFFSDEQKTDVIEEVLNRLTVLSYLRYDPKTDCFSYHNITDKTGEIEKRKIRAFWVPAQCGSRDVLQIFDMEYPAQLMFINPRNVVFDVTVCYSENEALLAKNIRDQKKIKGVNDAVNHIAVVGSPELGMRLGKYDFDCFCVLDPKTHVPTYGRCA